MITFRSDIDDTGSTLPSVNKVKQLFKDVLSDYDYEITVRPMFGCWRIFAGLIPFSAVIEDKLYFRAGDRNKDLLLIGDMDTYINEGKGFHGAARFYRKPGGFTTEEIRQHSLLSIKSCQDEKNKLKQKTCQRIKNLPNMNIKMERLLKKCGITTRDQLMKVGSVDAYHEILKMNKLTDNYDILYSIDAALKGIHKGVLPLATKKELTHKLRKFGTYNYAQ
ncbi:TfoX/Sxy family DNA transformation protein [Aliivibrio fischeri]|uniref:TfoX/Sxy family DNA transformation protein n=1 Tax=Aliivibrio fischeri TaxID=668 RepID=UPI0012D8FC18|nr:TfoX/Sxy family DNA transformation protein [Aliivibrio fischeri]MUJ20463.1 hypothetical protein [Aliivibrio fischeri]